MAYAHTHNSRQNALTLGAVAALHGVLGYVLVTGLAANGFIPEIATVFEANNIPIDAPVPTPPPQVEQKERTQPDVQPQLTAAIPTININTAPARLPPIEALIPPTDPIERIAPPAPPETPRFTPEGAKARNNPGTWVTENDYSSSAIRQGLEGVARVSLTIGADGRVTGCQITGSSGHEELDAATCQLVTKRARFEPARNENGDKVGGTYSSAVRWRITN